MAEVVSRVTMGLGVMMALTGVVRGSSPSPTTCFARQLISFGTLFGSSSTHPEGEILGGEDSAKMLLLIDDEHAVRPLCRAELTGIGHTDRVRNGESWERAKGRDRALLGASSLSSSPGALSTLRGRSLARQFRFDLLANGLWG